MSSYYKLDANKKVIPCSMIEWSDQYEELSKSGTKHVSDDEIDGKRISTVWLGLDHQWGNGAPILFETMVFDPVGKEIYCDRYSTWDESVEGHKKAIEWVKNGCKDE